MALRNKVRFPPSDAQSFLMCVCASVCYFCADVYDPLKLIEPFGKFLFHIPPNNLKRTDLGAREAIPPHNPTNTPY